MDVDVTDPTAPAGMPDGGEPPVVDPAGERRRRRRNRVPLLIVLLLTLVGVGGAVYDAFAPTTEEPLDAHAHTVVLQSCDAAFRTLTSLPPLTHNTTRAQLASRVVQEDSIFNDMVSRFDHVTPTNHDGRIALRDWTADWRSVLQRRAQYVSQLRATTHHVDFIVPIDKSAAPVTDRMNQYSRTHDLNPCLTGNLQLETLDTIRQYPKSDTASG
jgi:hypothetical protein